MLKSPIAAAVLIAALLPFRAFSQSQEPPPSRGQTERKPQQKEPTSTKQQAAPDQRHTEEPPPSVEALPAPQCDEKAGASKSARQNETPDNWALSDEIAVIATFVGFLQFAALIATVTVMKKSAERQLRAYVWAFSAMDTDADKLLVRTAVKNSGQTPAYDV